MKVIVAAVACSCAGAWACGGVLAVCGGAECDAGVHDGSPVVGDSAVASTRITPSACASSTFGDGGIVSLPAPPNPAAMAMAPGGAIVFSDPFHVVRLTPQGQLDSSFGNGGIAPLSNLPDVGGPVAIAAQQDGAVVVARTTQPANPNMAARSILFRLTPSGALDTSFGVQGIADVLPLAFETQLYSLTVMSDGSILATGVIIDSINSINNGDFLVVKYTASGGLDATFGNAGVVRRDVSGGSDLAQKALEQPDGKIVIAGCTNYPVGDGGGDLQDYLAIVRYDATGSIDTSFGTSGLSELIGLGAYYSCTLQPEPGAIGLALGPNQTIVAAGRDELVARFTASGQLDSAFGTNGVIHPSLVGFAVLANGSVRTATNELPSDGGMGHVLVARAYDPSGAADLAYGVDGQATATFADQNYVIATGALPASNDIIVVGSAVPPDGDGGNWLIDLVRFNCP